MNVPAITSTFSHRCSACNTPLGVGNTPEGQRIEFDIEARVWGMAGSHPTMLIRTTLAAVDHRDTCVYREAK